MNISSELPLMDYWNSVKEAISIDRNWGQKAGPTPTTDTMTKYDKNMATICANLPDKSMGELTAFELLSAVQNCKKQDGSPYAPSTLDSFLSILNDIYTHAQNRGDACNDLAYLSRGFSLLYTHPEGPLKAARELLKVKHNHLRSLNESQQSTLVKMIHQNITLDGRYLGLAILLYTGVRPSECRGLRWGDLIPFTQHPQRHMLSIVRSGNQAGKPANHLKTHNAYRKIGIHIELEQLIRLRYEFLCQQGYSDKDLAALPLCCYMNDFHCGCSHYQLATFVTSLLRERLRVSNQLLETCSLELITRETPTKEQATEDIHVCTYLLRHNFWTWLQAATSLTTEEKCYYMGHDMRSAADKNLRTRYNYEDKLWEMLLQLDHDIKHLGLHKTALHTFIDSDALIHTISNQGYNRIVISPELLQLGGTLSIQIITNELDDPIMITPRSPSKLIYQENQLQLDAKVFPYTHHRPSDIPINCDYANVLIRQRLKPLLPNATDTDTDSDFTSDDSEDIFEDITADYEED